MSGLSSKAPSRPILVIVSGPSGVGKDAVLNRMRELNFPLEFVVTLTTRPKRSQEKDKVDYHFVSRERFEQMIKDNKLLEWANVYGNYYGVPKGPIREALRAGRDAIARVDVQGAATIKKLMPQAVFIFLMPPSMEELTARLESRLTESAEAMKRRLDTAEDEIKRLPMFDYAIVNGQDGIDPAVAKIKAIITAEKSRVQPGQAPFPTG